jgi:hypothetical protein
LEKKRLDFNAGKCWLVQRYAFSLLEYAATFFLS